MKFINKKTEGVAVVKIGGTNFNETISLTTDLLVSSQVLDGTPNVGIQHIQWATTNGTEKIIITRKLVKLVNGPS